MTLSAFTNPDPQSPLPRRAFLISILSVIASVAAAYAKGAL